MRYSTHQSHADTASLAKLAVSLMLAFTCCLTTPLEVWAEDETAAGEAIQVVATQGLALNAVTDEAPNETQDTQQNEQPDDLPPADETTGLTEDATDPTEGAAAPEPEVQSTENRYVSQSSTFAYQHDPRDNPSAMADIIVDENAVYGFSPSPTGSLKDYVEYDWTDPTLVEHARQQRIGYHQTFVELYDMIGRMRAANCSSEEIARAVSTRRNEIRLEAYKDDPEGLAKAKARNLELYGNENGGTPEFFLDKYGSWEKVIEKSLSVNSGMDACTGLYDNYYEMYVAAGQVPADPVEPTEPEQPTQPEQEPTKPAKHDSTDNGSPSSPNEKPPIRQTYMTSTATATLPATGDAAPPLAPLVTLACACLAGSAGLRRSKARTTQRVRG